jgi:hypothetical protein
MDTQLYKSEEVRRRGQVITAEELDGSFLLEYD